jgi:predicted DNA-binding transcriptional regulator AlpA
VSPPIKHTTANKSSAQAQTEQTCQSVFDLLPNSAFVREAQLIQKPKRSKYPAPLPFSAPTLWRMVKAKTFPAPVRLSSRVTAWKVGDVRAWIVARQQAIS